MTGDKIKTFMQLGGQDIAENFQVLSDDQRKLGAQLLLSEVLEYVIKGLGVTPVVDGQEIHQPDELKYKIKDSEVHPVEMLDGLADVAYTMYWNAHAFGLPLEEAFERVCDNNLEKFIKLPDWEGKTGPLAPEEWDDSEDEPSWPSEVAHVEVIKQGPHHYAVGKDKNGKVRKPRSFTSVELSDLVPNKR